MENASRFGKQTIFRESGEIDQEAAQAQATKGDVFLGEYLHLAGVPWAPEPDGAEHCQNLARLVTYMAELPPSWGGLASGALDVDDRKVLHAVAMLYCTGRREGMEGYEARSAANAAKFFHDGGGDGTFWGTAKVRDEVCRLIYKHTDPEFIAQDKRLQVFEDAVRFECVRYAPNTRRGLEILRQECSPEKFHLGWSKSNGEIDPTTGKKQPSNLETWMTTRGWRGELVG